MKRYWPLFVANAWALVGIQGYSSQATSGGQLMECFA